MLTQEDWEEFHGKFPAAGYWLNARGLKREQECLAAEKAMLDLHPKFETRRHAWVTRRLNELRMLMDWQLRARGEDPAEITAIVAEAETLDAFLKDPGPDQHERQLGANEVRDPGPRIETNSALESTDELKLIVPTYYGDSTPGKLEFDEPDVPVVIYDADGVRVVLGSHDRKDMDKPDVQIERRPGGWAIFLHPLGGGDPSGAVYFLDDGRSFVQPELDLGTTDAVEFLECDARVPRELDRVS